MSARTCAHPTADRNVRALPEMMASLDKGEMRPASSRGRKRIAFQPLINPDFQLSDRIALACLAGLSRHLVRHGIRATAEASERRRKRSEDGLVASKLPWRRRIGFLISSCGFAPCALRSAILYLPSSIRLTPPPGAGQCRKNVNAYDPYPDEASAQHTLKVL
jgi:hypothetical protein